ncbi:hypothetical protein LJ754_15755 [Arthrobacter sp. zg-Y40]|uniref:hypothetical protein n=1 Tax=Arthrobacter sp. zg-Y40 TaxID=2886939 RepID=UPI001D152EEC|nr:hypothetical protein [Arthrobacter sp. zg-Y40]MCC3280605.1 hypothetical protein [Arthrobacter sp. zg-Y40]
MDKTTTRYAGFTRAGAFRAGAFRAAAAGLGLTLAFALTGCGGGDDVEERSKPAASASQKSAKPAKSAQPSRSAAGPGTGGSISGANLAALLDEMNTDLDIGGTVVEESDLKRANMQAVEAMRGAEYSPCNPTEDTDLAKASEEASMAALAIDGNAPGKPDSISVISWPGEEPVDAEIETSKRQLSACPQFTLTVNGQTISSVTEEADMPPVGEASQAYQTRSTANGVTETTLILTAWSGTNSVQITLNEAGDPREAIRYTAPVLEEVLNRLEG